MDILISGDLNAQVVHDGMDMTGSTIGKKITFRKMHRYLVVPIDNPIVVHGKDC